MIASEEEYHSRLASKDAGLLVGCGTIAIMSRLQKNLWFLFGFILLGVALGIFGWTRFTRIEQGYRIGPFGVFYQSCGSGLPAVCDWNVFSADWRTFRVLSDHFSADHKSVYVRIHGIPMTRVEQLEGADPSTFVVLDDSVSTLGIDNRSFFIGDISGGSSRRIPLSSIPAIESNKPFRLSNDQSAALGENGLYFLPVSIRNSRCSNVKVCTPGDSLRVFLYVIDMQLQRAELITNIFESLDPQTTRLTVSPDHMLELRPDTSGSVTAVIREIKP